MRDLKHPLSLLSILLVSKDLDYDAPIWLIVCSMCVMSPTSGIYWVELDFINNYKEPQLWLVLLRYNADMTKTFPYVIIYGIRAGPVIPFRFKNTTPQSGP